MKIQSKWVIINSGGQIIDHELLTPFTYLRSIAQGLEDPGSSHRDSEQDRLGAQIELTVNCFQLSDLNKAYVFHYSSEQFLDLVRFEQRSNLDELPEDWKKVGSGR